MTIGDFYYGEGVETDEFKEWWTVGLDRWERMCPDSPVFKKGGTQFYGNGSPMLTVQPPH